MCVCVFVSGFFLVLAREKTRYFTPRIPVKEYRYSGGNIYLLNTGTVTIFFGRQSAGGSYCYYCNSSSTVVVYDKVSDLLPLDSSLYFTS